MDRKAQHDISRKLKDLNYAKETGNDDTKEPIVAHYGRIDLLCNVE